MGIDIRLSDDATRHGRDEAAVREATTRCFTLLHELSALTRQQEEQAYEESRRENDPSFLESFRTSRRARRMDALSHELMQWLTAEPCLVDAKAWHRDALNGTKEDYQLLHYACKLGLSEAVAMLAQRGADLNALCQVGTPAVLAIANGHTETLQVLLEKGANPSLESPFRTSSSKHHPPIYFALWKHDLRAMELLLQHGYDVNMPYNNNFTNALCSAAFYTYEPSLRYLFDAGANPNLAVKNAFPLPLFYTIAQCETPLHTDTRQRIELFLDAGADLISSPSNSDNAMHFAQRQKGGSAVSTLLFERYKEACSQRNRFAAHEGQYVPMGAYTRLMPEDVTAHDLVLFANVGFFDEAMDHRFWHGQEEHARELLHRLPPWMATQAMKHQLWLTHAEPSTEISDRALDAPLVPRGVAR